MEIKWFNFGKQRFLTFSNCHSPACKYQMNLSLDCVILEFLLLNNTGQAADLCIIQNKQTKTFSEFCFGIKTEVSTTPEVILNLLLLLGAA